MRGWAAGGLAMLLGLAFVGVLSLPGLDRFFVLALSNGAQLAAALAAAGFCLRASHRTSARRRRAWLLLAAGTGSWGSGQLVWSYYEVVLAREVPFPSAADVGFLLFPFFAALGLLLWRETPVRASERARDLLDGLIVGGSLLVLSWSTTLGSVVADGGSSELAVILSLAYPVGDVVLLTVAILMLGAVGASERSTLLLVVGGVAGLAFADSAYVYLVAVGSYSSSDLVSAGWVFGFLLIAAGAAVTGPPTSEGRLSTRPVEAGAVPGSGRLRMLLPYLPLVAAITSLTHKIATAPTTPLFDLALGVALVVLVLARQFLAMHDNYRLLGELQVIRDALQYQALHDPLTGLANRTLFADRVTHALEHRAVDVSVLYCDLDNFKRVNDESGHQFGDALLRIVAHRLLECVRPGDTVARLGGDEFAVLLEDARGAERVADRIIASLGEPFRIADAVGRTSVSVGAAHFDTSGAAAHDQGPAMARRDPAANAEDLLKQADSAMYLAKAEGKGRAVHAVVRGSAPGRAGPALAASPSSRTAS